MALGHLSTVIVAAAFSAATPEARATAEDDAKFLLESVDMSFAFAWAGTCGELDRKRRLRWLEAHHRKLVAKFERITGRTVEKSIVILEADECSNQRYFDRNLLKARQSLRSAEGYLRLLR